MSWAKDEFERLQALPKPERLAALRSLLAGHQEPDEWYYLECKTAPSGSLNAETKGKLASEVSAFANAEGGVILWGLERKDQLARVKSGPSTQRVIKATERPMAGIGEFVSLVNRESKHCTVPAAPDVQTISVPLDDGSGSGFAVTYVAQSEVGPHQANMGGDKISGKYYRRHQDKAHVMRHYELDEMFGRRPRPVLLPEVVVIRDPGDNSRTIKIAVDLWNIGTGIAKWAALEVRTYPAGRVWTQVTSFLDPSRDAWRVKGIDQGGEQKDYTVYQALPPDEASGIIHPGNHKKVLLMESDIGGIKKLLHMSEYCLRLRVMAESLRPWEEKFCIPGQLFAYLYRFGNQCKAEVRKTIASFRKNHPNWYEDTQLIPVPEGCQWPF